MTTTWAADFAKLPAAIAGNANIRAKMLELIRQRRVPGKVAEGSGRLVSLRTILGSLAGGDISFDEQGNRR